jgi:hypothetical protein
LRESGAIDDDLRWAPGPSAGADEQRIDH